MLNSINPLKPYVILDSGTLLGLFRDGKILDNDSDIDLFCDLKHVETLLSVIEKDLLLIYSLKKQIYNGEIIKIILYPKYSNLLRVDIHIFKTEQSNRISPAYSWSKSLNLVQLLVRRFYFFIRGYLKFENLSMLNFLGLIQIKFWTYPKYFHDRTKLLHGWKIPYETETYLTTRYGDGWRKPAPKWDYWEDDGCLR